MTQHSATDGDGQNQSLHSRPMFVQFIDEAKKQDAPFYVQLSAIVSQDRDLLNLAAHARAMPAPNLFLPSGQSYV